VGWCRRMRNRLPPAMSCIWAGRNIAGLTTNAWSGRRRRPRGYAQGPGPGSDPRPGPPPPFRGLGSIDLTPLPHRGHSSNEMPTLNALVARASRSKPPWQRLPPDGARRRIHVIMATQRSPSVDVHHRHHQGPTSRRGPSRSRVTSKIDSRPPFLGEQGGRVKLLGQGDNASLHGGRWQDRARARARFREAPPTPRFEGSPRLRQPARRRACPPSTLNSVTDDPRMRK